MAVIKMMQGDSYSIPFTITMNETTAINPDIVSELEVCVGKENSTSIRKMFSEGSIWFDETSRQWLFRPTQEETLSMNPGSYDVIARMKFRNGDDSDVIGVMIGTISISDTHSEEVI